MPVEPMPPDRRAQDSGWSTRRRTEFQVELARRMMNVERLSDADMLQWTQLHAAQFAAIVDTKDEDGVAIRRLIVTNLEAAYEKVQQRMLH